MKKQLFSVVSRLLLIGLCSSTYFASAQVVYTVTNTNNAGLGSLRQAILDANLTPAYDTIRFAIPAVGPQKISLNPTNLAADELKISAPVMIDGFSQGGVNYNGLPLIQIDCNNMAATTLVDAIEISANADGTIIKGLNIVEQYGAAVRTNPGATDCIIEACTFGLDLDGLTRVASGFGTNGAITVSGAKTVIRQCAISGQNINGVLVFDSGDSTQIYNNLIGTTYYGISAAANNASGIYLLHNVQGVSITDNIISGNIQRGILLNGTATTGPTGTVIKGNRIGVNSLGNAAIPNNAGIYIVAGDSNLIGGAIATESNLISGNTVNGITLNKGTANAIVNNLIGTSVDGITPIPNGGDGIQVASTVSGSSMNHTIGGINANEGNLIAYNGGNGIDIFNGSATSSDSITILGNSIHSNVGIGINLSTDNIPSINDATDADTGPNQMLNYPILTKSLLSAGDLELDIDLDVPAGNYRIEVFSNPSGADPTMFGEGEIFIGAFDVVHPGSGIQSFSHTITGVTGLVVASDPISMTTTACKNADCTFFHSTSEFSEFFVTQALSAKTILFEADKISEDAVYLTGTADAASKGGAYDIYRKSIHEEEFSKIKEINSSTQTALRFVYIDDVSHIDGGVFYKVHYIDTDGSVKMSPMKRVDLIRSQEKALQIYPNPSSDAIKVLTYRGQKDMQYRIYNTSGIEVLYGLTRSGEEIHLESLPSGLYFIKVTQEDMQQSTATFILDK